jgi:ubiquinol-cytochrome c reductase iron-sulfur subunit
LRDILRTLSLVDLTSFRIRLSLNLAEFTVGFKWCFTGEDTKRAMANFTYAGKPGYKGETRRDFLYLTAAAAATVGVCTVTWPFIDSMNPAADVLALSSTEVDLAPIAVGQAVTVMWRGKPVFIRHRTPAEIIAAQDIPLSELRDPKPDTSRVKVGHADWLVVTGICTHLGCVPLGQRPTDNRGFYGGWFCPCHGSAYDTSGRIRQGPAPRNLDIPPYHFISDTRIRIG